MRHAFTYLATCLALISAAPASAGSGLPSAPDDIARIELLPGWRTATGEHMAALRIELAEGWKTYWRAPGDSGIPPSFDLKTSENVGHVEFHWPVPDVFVEGGVRTIGYKEELVLPMTITPGTAGAPIKLSGDLQFGVCLDICMPMQASLSMALPTGAATQNRAIKKALQARPDTSREAGVKKALCSFEPLRDGLRVRAEIHMPRLAPNEVVVLETADPEVWVAEVDSRREGGRIIAETDIVPPKGSAFALNRSELRFTVLGAGRGVDILGCTGG
ncbi:protein-disulfide reductase DsbD domain-containing protein [Aliiroseovarius crassostreae]|uniref:protein-disulfide reductase DsbD domain-containing protein n=1 Tax=Aliiroseovarius crassostreae TaxID=154981 RepID=UPI002205AF5F|nr:protein-disulfide reductase DsbD domain-containing protein [Aliiroseovarius crassostreae]UWQ05061.1 hypothetical protein K3X22_00865 [Aliiroseovarius crassostreae]